MISIFRSITHPAAVRLARMMDTIPPASIASTVFLLVTGAALGLGLPSGLSHPWDWSMHGIFFALLTVSLSGFFRGRALPAFLIAAAIAGAGEYAQLLLPFHQASLADFGASAIGALSAAGVLSIRIPVSFPAEELGFIERARAMRDAHGVPGE